MSWFLVGSLIGAICIVLFIVALLNPDYRGMFINFFEDTIYGEMLEDLDEYLEDSNKAEILGFSFMFSILTLLVCICILAICTLLSYIVGILIIFVLIFSNNFNKLKS